MMSENVILRLNGINKSFSSAKVLHDIHLEVRQGEVLGLVGENGAGKSTLMNILGGVLPRDSGTMELNGAPYEPATPKAAQKAGIAFIHQELNLFSNLTVAENLFLDELPTGRLWSVQYKKMHQQAREHLQSFGVNVSPTTKVGNLPMGIRQSIEITKALIKNAQIIIFDEPTTSLSAKEKENLISTIRRLHADGVTVVYISHILEDVFALCDRIAVLRDGQLISVDETARLDRTRVIKKMVGRDLNQVYPTIEKTIGDVVYEARGVNQNGSVKNVSFTLRAGEIVGLFGLMGSGRTELVRCLFGIDRMQSGEVYFNGTRLQHLTPQECIEHGIAFVTEDRRQEGLLMPKPVRDNLVTVKLDQLRGRLGMINRQREDTEAETMIKELRIRVGDKNRQAVRNLSGGNQQKVVLGKWLMCKPMMFLMDEPTRGVDVGAKYEIYTIMGDMAKAGTTILFISSEMEELMGVCDRILVISKGRLAADIPRHAFNQETIIRYALEGAN